MPVCSGTTGAKSDRSAVFVFEDVLDCLFSGWGGGEMFVCPGNLDDSLDVWVGVELEDEGSSGRLLTVDEESVEGAEDAA